MNVSPQACGFAASLPAERVHACLGAALPES